MIADPNPNPEYYISIGTIMRSNEHYIVINRILSYSNSYVSKSMEYNIDNLIIDLA